MRSEEQIRGLARTLAKTEERIKQAARIAKVKITEVPELLGPLANIKGMKDAFNWALGENDEYMDQTIALLKDVQAMFEREKV